MLIARAELEPGHVRDIRIANGAIVEVDERLRPRRDEETFDARNCVVTPGLHDHHVHLRALAAASASLDLTAISGADALRSAFAAGATGAWVRAVGYHESIAGELDRVTLDALTPPATPVRVQHRSGIAWILNSEAMRAAGLDTADEPGVDRATGRLWRRDDLLRRVSSLSPDDLAALGARAAAVGITGLTDATPDGAPSDPRDLARDLRAAGVTQRLHLMGPVGALPPHVAHATLGPLKVLLDDDALPSIDDLSEAVRTAHTEGRAVAFHCVTRVQLIVAITAVDAAGARPGDRIEHGSVIPAELLPDLRRLGVTVVSQPHFVFERGDDYRRDADRDDVDSLYRMRSLIDAGIPVAAGTDAPFGAFDPWASMVAATERRTRAGHELGAVERVDPLAALRCYLGHPDDPARLRTIGVGKPADLCVLGVPWRALPTSLPDGPVVRTIIAGRDAPA